MTWNLIFDALTFYCDWQLFEKTLKIHYNNIELIHPFLNQKNIKYKEDTINNELKNRFFEEKNIENDINLIKDHKKIGNNLKQFNNNGNSEINEKEAHIFSIFHYQVPLLLQVLDLFSSFPLKEPILKFYKQPTPSWYMSFPSKGISLEFVPKHDTSVKNETLNALSKDLGEMDSQNNNLFQVNSVIIYNDHQGFKKYNHELPFGLNLDMTNQQIVHKFREPTNKGGGRKAPIWIEYNIYSLYKSGLISNTEIKHLPEFKGKSLMMMIEFKRTSWEDIENPIACIYFYVI